jgi:hypothetical protein
MRRFGSYLVVLGALLALTARARADFLVTGPLTGAQEVPPNLITPATGTFVGILHTSGPTALLTFTVNYANLIGGDVVAANFGDAPRGVAGPDVRDYDPGLFSSPDGIFMGTWSSSDAQPLTPALVHDLMIGNIYFEIATLEFPGGPAELRGQLTTSPEPATIALALLGSAGLVVMGLKRRRATR